MQVKCCFENEGFLALRSEWNSLLQRSYTDSLFLTWEWQSVWWKHWGNGELVLLSFRRIEDGSLVGIVPLFRSVSRTGELALSLVGGREISDYLDLIIEVGWEDAIYAALLDCLGKEVVDWDLIDLCNIPQDSLTCVRLRALADARDYQSLVEIEDVCPIIALPNTWEGYLMSIDKKQRHELRRKLRRAESGADTRFVVVGSQHHLQTEMKAFIGLHQMSAPEKSKFMNSQMQEFFLDMACTMQEAGWLQLTFIEMDGVKAASLLNFDYGGAVLAYNSGYDPLRFRHLSPGVVITARCIEHAIKLSRSKFDFLRGDEVYKYRFGANNTQVLRLLIAKPHTSTEAIS